MTVDQNEFKNALQRWASGISVVTTKTESFGTQGMTVTAFSSVSVDPPQVLVCINANADTGDGIQESKCFAVNILNSNQEDISNQFAGSCSQKERFSNVSWSEGMTGAPILNESLASLDCKVVKQISAGTHQIFIGEVRNVVCRSGEPLLYYRSAYLQLS